MQLLFSKNVGVVPWKSVKFQNPVIFFLKGPLWSMAAKLGNFGTKMFLYIYKILSNFYFNPMICDPTLFPAKTSPNIAKSNRVFPGKGRWDRALILKYLYNPMVEVFPRHCLSFSISVIFSEKRVVKVGRKVKTLGSSLFHGNSNSSKFYSNNVFACYSATPGESFGNIGPYLEK